MGLQDAAYGRSAIDAARENALMFTGSLSIAAVFVRLLEAYLALIIVDSAK